MLKSYRVGWWVGGVGWGGVVADEILVSAQGPWFKVLGLRVLGQGLTILMWLNYSLDQDVTLFSFSSFVFSKTNFEFIHCFLLKANSE